MRRLSVPIIAVAFLLFGAYSTAMSFTSGTVTFKRNTANTPVFLLATGDVTIAGTISVNGKDDSTIYPGRGGSGGFDGGMGGKGIAPGGGNAGSVCSVTSYSSSSGGGVGSNTTTVSSGGAGGCGGGGKKTVLPGGTCQLMVTFKPTSAGTKSATLQIITNDPDAQTLEIQFYRGLALDDTLSLNKNCV